MPLFITIFVFHDIIILILRLIFMKGPFETMEEQIMEDKAILDLYFARDELAITETDRKYGGYCYSIANRILNSQEDSEETVSDTYWQTWNSIPPQRPNFLKLFLAKVTRNLAFTRWRKRSAEKRGGGELELALEELASCIPGREQVDDRLNLQELSKTIRCFLAALPERDGNIFLRRYFFVEDADTIAEHYHMKRANVNVILSRTRVKLKSYLKQEGYDL
jgi:RNA polymerase sigma-70 factor (ECF subfamily)